jgi:DnaJ family protein C protein 19
MILILWVLGIVIVTLLVRLLLNKAPSNGKPFLLRAAVVVIVLVAIGLALRGLWPVAMSLFGGLMVYGKPVLKAFGLWQTIKGFKQIASVKNAPTTAAMDKAQARKILELEDQASAEEIIAAHKKMMAKNHPDKGGSTYLASQINQAKDVLLKD